MTVEKWKARYSATWLALLAGIIISRAAPRDFVGLGVQRLKAGVTDRGVGFVGSERSDRGDPSSDGRRQHVDDSVIRRRRILRRRILRPAPFHPQCVGEGLTVRAPGTVARYAAAGCGVGGAEDGGSVEQLLASLLFSSNE